MRRRLAPMLALLLSAPAVAVYASPAGGGWMQFEVAAGTRVLAAAAPPQSGSTAILTVVIEGDGEAHDGRGAPRADPTPRDPVGLKIAKAWPSGAVAWLGRLCQFVRDPACTSADWTTGRYSPAAIEAADAGVEALKRRAGASRVRLVGWSGGGTIAALVAARRTDVVGLVTIAAPLDLAAWSAWHGASPLTGSLDPAGLAPLDMPQLHLLGAFDTVNPPLLAKPAAQRLAGPSGAVVVVNARHTCCWAAHTPAMAEVGEPATGFRNPGSPAASKRASRGPSGGR